VSFLATPRIPEFPVTSNRPPRRAVVAELVLAGLLVSSPGFSVLHLVLLLLLASQSLWHHQQGWSALGLRWPQSMRRTLVEAVIASVVILVATRVVIVPLATRLAGAPVDLEILVQPGDARSLRRWLVQAWTLAALGEEMVFRGYIMQRVVDLVGETRIGWSLALVASSAMFGIAHRYQGWAGVIMTAGIGGLLGLLFLSRGRNLWVVVICHAVVDTVGLLAIFLGHKSLLFP
jgi:uncharacterized protein